VELPRRGDLARFAAPAAFLVAVTVAVLLVRAGFEGGSDSRGATTALTTTQAVTTTTTATTTTTTTQPAKSYYTIQAGDTLDIVAARYGKTADDLLALNPGIDPHALRIGQKIRVG
jgi:LysM repeat protein